MRCTLTSIEKHPQVIYDRRHRPQMFLPGETKTVDILDEDLEHITERSLVGLMFTIKPDDKPVAAKAGSRAASEASEESVALAPRKRLGRPKKINRPKPEEASELLLAIEGGMKWFALRQAARRALGDAWPGPGAKRADIIAALKTAATITEG